ncbi:hypothetical protein M378DRAFT_16864 [Amanita muscaria Koide BX008]|uniref:Uncharacterized protein n=1 Tax=Amanita muscaria (strain Koide BX008) TaxID=946122 RepID=A0A0C2W6A9_AMAMK|nr:hypothetical protein M378DRAFT_16864 [Amanita muscaria Koide BX008]
MSLNNAVKLLFKFISTYWSIQVDMQQQKVYILFQGHMNHITSKYNSSIHIQ